MHLRLSFVLVLGVALALAAPALAGCAEPEVVRLVDGRPQAGRYISDDAYALFARGAEAEVRGDVGNAVRAFQAAAIQDPESPEIWTRLGALHCSAARAPAEPPPQAMSDFARAEAADASFAPLHRERARCLLEHGRVQGALSAVERAVALDPSDPETFVVKAQALERAGKVDDARRTLRGLTVSHPRAGAPWVALLELGKRAGDVALVHEAARRAGERGVARAFEAAEPMLASIDAALRAGDLNDARRLAGKARLGEAELAVRAAALGRITLAREQAALVLGADPADASARIALASAAELAGDTAALDAAMRAIPRRHTIPSPLARLLFAELLGRRSGTDAARAWLGPTGANDPSAQDDALLAATAERVHARLARR